MSTHTLDEIAKLIGAEVVGDPAATVEGVADLESARPTDLSFLAINPYGGSIAQYRRAMEKTQAGAVVVAKDLDLPAGRHYLKVDEPSQAFQQVVALYQPQIPSGFAGIHPSAVVHPEATVDPSASVGPCSVIDAGAQIGANTVIGAQVYIGAKTKIGRECHLHPQVVIREGCTVGNRVVIQPGATIGGCGFGFTTDKMGKHTKVKQLGSVVIEDDVEIGANTTIDRARMGETRIRRGSKLDNLIQIAHGVEVGEDNLIVGQTGIAGSTKTGRNVVLAGQVAVNGHIEIGDQVIVAARSGVMKSIKEPGKYVGEPAMSYADYRRHWMQLLRLERNAKRLEALEKQVKELSEDG